jgi:hypothetical protein
MQHVHDQEPGRFPSISFRTLWSRSILRVEQHPLGLWVFDARYDPAGDARAVARLGGTAPGTGLPSDLPVDVAASLVRNASFTRESIAETEKTQPLEPFDLSVLCALDPGEATTVARLRAAIDAWADDEERFGGLLQLMSAYGYAALLFEAAARLPAGDLRERLLTYLRPDDGDDDPGGASR